MNLFGRMLLLAMFATTLINTGCTSAKIASHPPGARILFNGEDTGYVTPQTFKLRHIKKGRYMVSLVKENYVMAGPPQLMRVKTSPAKIFGTILFLPIALPIELSTSLWKKASPRHLTRFVMHPVTADPGRGAPLPGPGAPVSGTLPPASYTAPVIVQVQQAPAADQKDAGLSETEKRLQNLNDLYKKGLITKEEYEARRKEILKDL